MTQQKVYNHYFDETHPLKPFTHASPANPNAKPPRNAVRSEAPEPGLVPGFCPCRDGKKWKQIEDHRGEEGFVGENPIRIEELGPYPDGWTKDHPEPEGVEKERMDILSRLDQIDAESIRPLRAIAQGEATDADHEKLAALDEEAQTLRAKLATLA